MNALELFNKTLINESKAIHENLQTDENLISSICNEILSTKGKLIISGVGKSGLIGKKISATLSSTGTPSMFIHPTEAFHGDLGAITKDDLFLSISNSGETEELIKLIPYLRSTGIKIISIVGEKKSTLANFSDFPIVFNIEDEACPLNLAPTTSTTVTLAIGDALATTLIHLRKFEPSNFAKFHPGGSLAKKVLYKVSDRMKSLEGIMVNSNSSFEDVLTTINSSKIGACVVMKNDNIFGVISDGDMRRAIRKHHKNVFDLKALEFVINESPYYIYESDSLYSAQEQLINKKISFLIVKNNSDRPVGTLSIYDI